MDSDSDAVVFDRTISVPSVVSALALWPDDVLCVGSDDGCVRWYNLPSTKVVRAIRPLGAEVSSIALSHFKKNLQWFIWVASGRQVLSFPAVSDKVISTAEDATSVLNISEGDDDVLNELCISENGKLLAFSSDSGAVGIVDLSSKDMTHMKSHHNSICGSVKFIPDRPSEVVSGGYDSALLHFDVGQGNVLSRYDIATPAPSGTDGVSLSPPFVLSVSISSTGLVAASTADGRVWLGGGGEKRPGAKKKRSRKWEGLKQDEGIWLQVAEGPVVSSVFTQDDHLLTCSLLGVLAEYTISRDFADKLQATKSWSGATKGLAKVNAIAINQSFVAVGGFDKAEKGIVEVWRTRQKAVS